jgi:hypothetical protein
MSLLTITADVDQDVTDTQVEIHTSPVVGIPPPGAVESMAAHTETSHRVGNVPKP